MLKCLRQLVTIIVSSSLLACSTTQTIAPETRLKDNSRTIRVVLHDNRTIKLSANDYNVNAAVDSTYIKGVGWQISGEDGKETGFKGSIAFHDIREIQVIEPTKLSEGLTPIIIGSVAGLLLIILLLSSADFGHM